MEARRREKIAERIAKTNQARETLMLELEKEEEVNSSKGGGDQSDRAGEQSPRLEAGDYLGTMNIMPGKRPELPTVAKSVDITSGAGLL